TIAGLSQDIRKDYTKRLRLRDHYIRQRVSYYQAASEIIKKHPFFGVGPGNFAVSYRQNEKYKINTYNPNYVLNHVHNDFLEIWVEYGLFSLLAYLGIVSVFFYEWAKGFKNSDEPNQQMVFILIFCSLSGYLFYSLLTVAGRYTSSVFYFWVVMGIGYLYFIKEAQDEDKSILILNRLKGNKKISFAVAMAILLIFGATGKKILAHYVSDVYMSKAYGFASRGNYDEALKLLNHAIRLQDKSVEAYYQRGFVHFSENRIDRAIEDYDKVIEMAPNYVNVDFNLAACFYKKKDWINTIRLANISHRLFPDYLPNMMMLAYSYHNMGKHQKSLTYCDLILKRYKGHQPALKFRQKLEGILKQKEENYDGKTEFFHFNFDGAYGGCPYLSGVCQCTGRWGRSTYIDCS
ncbi:tetratricopeptide repeat protein, partial [Desulfobacterales bacterium HSG2]|nr:tetratricopeptide repeat protein [Desulfobacterales bacterium HSG2]